jgi:hypothetical protein
MAKSKRILCVDFDGVLHSYISPWRGPAHIPDPPVPGAIDFLRAASERYTVCVFSSRSQSLGGIDAMKSWLSGWARVENAERIRNGDAVQSMDWISEIEWPTAKPSAYLSIDDRAYCFQGTWPTLEEIDGFVPWNRRPEKSVS